MKVGDVDSQRMVLRVEQGKGREDRYALLEQLCAWWRVAHAQGRMLPGGWLFPGLDPMDRLSTRQFNPANYPAAEDARTDKRVSMQTLRRSFTTHPPEARVAIRISQVLLGHKKLDERRSTPRIVAEAPLSGRSRAVIQGVTRPSTNRLLCTKAAQGPFSAPLRGWMITN